MKKIWAISIMLMMLISITSLAVADEEAGGDNQEEQEINQIDNETEKQIEIMKDSLGAEIRLLQLQKAILKNIIKGAMAIEVLKGLDFNTTVLEEILDQMKQLLEEVKEANTSSNESVMIFIELKTQAKNLTKQFRETVKELLSDEELNELRQRIREMVSEQVQNLSKQIRNRIRQFNRNQLYRLFGLIGEANYSLIDEYLNGNISLNQTKFQICKMINQMTKEKRYGIFSEIKEENIKKKINAESFINQMHGKGKGKGKPK
ncbi:MAG: hypothetical protein QHH15_04355 [Candidatus Thermoplasmatota archaeon]|jgi:ABC-type cobalt transport system substrate-binding protein|nr:hypothetical protein [Candidatus Thermoplasmatota archaeon]